MARDLNWQRLFHAFLLFLRVYMINANLIYLFSGDHPFVALEDKGLQTDLPLQMPTAESMAKGWLVDG